MATPVATSLTSADRVYMRNAPAWAGEGVGDAPAGLKSSLASIRAATREFAPAGIAGRAGLTP